MGDNVLLKRCILNAILDLMRHDDYSLIQVKEIAEKANISRRTFYRYFKCKEDVMQFLAEDLMNKFAQQISSHHSEGIYEITKSYFEFWEDNIEVLHLLKKAHLLYFIEDRLAELIIHVAQKVNHIHSDAVDLPSEKYHQELYKFHFRIAGFWKITLLWSEEIPRKSPIEMTQIINQIF